MNRKKKIILAVICALSMTMYVFTVSAAEATVPPHGCVKVVVKRTKLDGYIPKNDYYHIVKYEVQYGCQVKGCPTAYGNIIEDVDEAHNWKRYDDLGCHGAHRYRLTCGDCNGTAEISIPCDGDQYGNHRTPW